MYVSNRASKMRNPVKVRKAMIPIAVPNPHAFSSLLNAHLSSVLYAWDEIQPNTMMANTCHIEDLQIIDSLTVRVKGLFMDYHCLFYVNWLNYTGARSPSCDE